MSKTHKDLEKDLTAIFLSGPLSEITFYQVNDSFFEIPEEGYWIIDAIQLKFPKGIITATLNIDIDSYAIEPKPFSESYDFNNYHILENDNIAELKKYLGLNVVDVNFTSLEFEYIVDYTMRTEKEKRFVQVILEFQNKSILQLAFVDYSVVEGGAPHNLSFNLMNELLVSTKKIIDIQTHDQP